MRAKKRQVALLAVIFTLSLAAHSAADISNAAVLFLRIAPGARAAGMGEAFVAVADDATATHFNPAGLGTSPLAEDWTEIKVPPHLRPLKSMAVLKQEGGSDFRAYDVWAVTAQGLVRYDHRRWHTGEVFSTKTNQTVRQIVKAYFNVSDDERLPDMVALVARANNARSLSYLERLRDSVLSVVPSEYSGLASLTSGLDSLVAAFELCLINWDRVADIQELLSEGLKDSVLNETECDRINFAVERSKRRFIPEELVIPYATLVGTDITAIASTKKALLIASAEGLFAFNGTRWQTLTGAEELPSANVLCLYPTSRDVIYIGTDSGLAQFAGLTVRQMDGAQQLPTGAVTAIGASGGNNVWISLNNDLYHWDGQAWSNSFAYTVAVDETPEEIARKFSVYGTDREMEEYLSKFKQLNDKPTTVTVTEDIGLTDLIKSQLASDTTDTTEELSQSADTTIEKVDPQTAQPGDDTSATGETMPATDQPDTSNRFAPGTVVRAPYLAEIKGRVNAIHVGFSEIWLGTEYGIMVFDHNHWSLPGYRDHLVVNGQTLEDIAEMKTHDDYVSELRYESAICDINDLDCDPDKPLADSQVVKIYRNPAAASVNYMDGQMNQVYFATSDGIIEFDGGLWRRVEQADLARVNAVYVTKLEQGLWFASDRNIVVRTSGRSEIALMYAKWLPELADDLYYSFGSFSTNVSGWGTFGGNVTFISYGSINRRGEHNEDLGTFESFDIAFTGSYGASLSGKLKGGISAKLIHSRLSPEYGAGKEKGKGTSTGFAIDLGLLYDMTPRLNWGLAVTNIGPKMAYIDASQADPLPRNLAFGFAYNLLESDYYRLLMAAEVNKMLVGLNDGFKKELEQVVFNGGAEFLYANIIAFRAGYIHDEEGKLKTATAGVGLYLFNTLRFDFSYYFGSNVNESRKGIKPLTLSLVIN